MARANVGVTSLLHVAVVVAVGCLATAFGQADDRKERHVSSIRFPPEIRLNPDAELAYKFGDTVELQCEADAYPSPTYEWRKNGHRLNLNSQGIHQTPGKGTITITIDDLKSHHDGEYQCLATNSFGTALSTKTLLKRATLLPFPTVKEARVHRPTIGSPLTLRCSPPASYPTGSIYWGETKNGPKLRPIENNNRISLDYEGSLHFTNIEAEDARNGAHYVCVVQNLVLRNIVEGEDQKLFPEPISGSPRYEQPRVMWSSPTTDIAVRGQTKKMKCIFSGYPTPRVSWRRIDTPMPAKNNLSSHGQELVIPDAEFSDKGRYQCFATNTESGTSVPREFTLTVESTPFWRNGVPPESINTSEDEEAVFECNVNGFPRPQITWTVDGLPLEARPNSRRSVSAAGNTLTFTGVTRSDAQVIQCNASNTHGYIFANAYLNVLAEKPSFRQPPKPIQKVAVGRVATLTCRVFGAPKPTIMWQKGVLYEEVGSNGDSRMKVLPSGDLEIQNVQYNDNDTYQCYACNKLGCAGARGLLLVIEKTMIVEPPRAQAVTANSNVTLTCKATTDKSEVANLRIEWRRNGEYVYNNDRITTSDRGGRLNIIGTHVSDSGKYTCHVENGIDSDTADAYLSVRDRPDPPLDVKLASTCQSTFATIRWLAPGHNNDAITEYIVYYVSSHDFDGTAGVSTFSSPHEGIRVDASSNVARVPLAPWAEYTFYVAAVNNVGTSNMSVAQSSEDQRCITPPAKPRRSPRFVCTESRRPDQLVIVWEPMLRHEHHGDGFRYVVSYERRGQYFPAKKIEEIYDWRQSELVVNGQETYSEFEISVLARNALGDAPLPTRIIGYSGEDVPLERPDNFQLDWSSMNATSATFTWSRVDESFARIRGFFRGYQIQFWRESHPNIIRKEDIILHPWARCRSLDDVTGRRRRSSRRDPMRGSTNMLWPYSTITAGVVVLNGAKEGNISNLVTFDTPEGVPGPVQSFRATLRGSNHIQVTWRKPDEVNGLLVGYLVGYREVMPYAEYDTHEMFIDDPQQTTKKIFDLAESTTYELSIWAMTKVGRGVETVIQAATVEQGVPDQPLVTNTSMGYDYVVVGWEPSVHKPPINPAPEFVVEYQPEGSNVWIRTDREKETYQVNVSGLIHGQTYHIRIVALSPPYENISSVPITLVIGMPQVGQVTQSVASSSWFLVLILLLVLLLLVLVIVLLFRYNRGAKYPVLEKERKHGANGGHLDEEDRFCEYVRGEDPVTKKSQGSLESSSRSDDDEGSDSLGVYEDADPTKFNDEGSFIDQSGYKKTIDGRMDGNVTSPTVV